MYYSSKAEFLACPKAREETVVKSKELFKCVARTSLLSEIINNEKTRSIIHMVTDLKQTEGCTVKVRRLNPLTGVGVINCERLEGREKCNGEDYDYINLGRIREAVCLDTCGGWGVQCGRFKLSRDQGLEMLKNWFVDIVLASFFNQAASYNGSYTYFRGERVSMVPQLRGFNPITASTNHYRIVNTPANGTTPAKTELLNITNNFAGEDALQAKDKLTLSAIRQLAYKMYDYNNVCGDRSLNVDGIKYVLFLHPSQIADLKADPEWKNWICCVDEKGKNNRLTTGAEGIIDGILIKSSPYVPYGVHPDGTPNINVRRALLAGVDAVELALGGYQSSSQGNIIRIPFSIKYRDDDYDDNTYMGFSAIFGLKKTRFGDKDSGVMVLSSYVEEVAPTQVENPALFNTINENATPTITKKGK